MHNTCTTYNITIYSRNCHTRSACDERHPRKHGFRLFLWLTPFCSYRVTKRLWSWSKGTKKRKITSWCGYNVLFLEQLNNKNKAPQFCSLLYLSASLQVKNCKEKRPKENCSAPADVCGKRNAKCFTRLNDRCPSYFSNFMQTVLLRSVARCMLMHVQF